MLSHLKIILGCLYMAWAVVSCGGTSNVGASRSEVTAEEKAEKLMNDGDYDGAIEILEPLYVAEPEEYFRLPLLASAYAGKAGVDIFSIITGMLGGSDDEEEDEDESVFDQIDAFLPDDYDTDSLELLDDAVETLEAIPASKRGVDGDAEYGESAEFQLTLFRLIYTSMYVGLIKSGALGTLTAEDVLKILETLRNASADAGESGEALAEAIDTTLDAIDETDGESEEERFASYIGSALQ